MDRRQMRERMAQHPKSVAFAEAQRVLEAYGWSLDRVRGSHHVFKLGGSRLTIPLLRPTILPIYVRQILALTDGADDEPEEDHHDESDA